MTLEHRRTATWRAVTMACALVAALMVHTGAEAKPITFGFETFTDTGDPFGVGLFTINDDDFPFPYVVIGSWPTASSVFVDFLYIDPHVGFLSLADVASVHFELGFDPATQQVVPATSLWAFVIADVGNFHVLQGAVSGLGPQGLNTKSMVLDPSTGYDEVFLAATFPQRVPEPVSVLLIGVAITGFVARRRLSRR